MQLIISLIVAIGAAVRGNWSPCGESLQAQIHPLGERSRGNVWAVTVGSFTVASALAGGLLTGLLAWIGTWFGIEPGPALAVTAIVGVVAGGLDLAGVRPWSPKRQVNENWINRYRGWVYGAAFGAQLGVGFSVFVMSWGYYAMLVAAFVSGSFALGALIGAVFGICRGLILYVGYTVRTPERLAEFHLKMAAWKTPVFRATAILMLAAGTLAVLSP